MSEEAGETRRRRRGWRLFAFIVAGWIAAEIVAGLVCALARPSDLAELRRLWRPHPYRVCMLIAGRRSAEGRFSINSQGFRGPELAPRKPPGTIRIACLGDETTFGDAATTDGHTYPACLERLLRTRQRAPGGGSAPIEVINAGVPGYTSLEALIYFEMWLVDYQLDAAILQVGAHDAEFMACFRDFAGDYTHARKVFELPRPRAWERSFVLSLAGWRRRTPANPFFGIRTASPAEWSLTDPARLEVDEAERRRCFRPERIAAFSRNVRNFVLVARAQGVTPVLSTVVCSPKAGFVGEVIEQLNESVRKTATALSAPCVDLARELPWTDQGFEGPTVPRDAPEGLERMGEMFAENLIRLGIVAKAAAARNAGEATR